MHIPDDPLYHEKFYFAPGDLGFQNWKTARGNLGVCICWDQWYPEAARLTALRGAEIIFYPTAIGWHPKEKKEFGRAQHSSWETIQRSHGVSRGTRINFRRSFKKTSAARKRTLSLDPEAIRPSVAIEQGTITIASKRAEPLTNGTFMSLSE